MANSHLISSLGGAELGGVARSAGFGGGALADSPAAEHGRTFDVEVLTDLAALDAAAADWRALEAVSGPNAVFQSHAHTVVWARNFVAGNRSQRLHIVVVRGRGLPRLIVPLGVFHFPGIRIGKIAGDPVSQYSELLADPSSDLAASFNVALNKLRDDGIDLLLLDGVRDDSMLLRCAGDRMGPSLARRSAPFADLMVETDHAKFIRSRGKSFAKGIRQRRNQADQAGVVSFKILQGGPAAGAAMAQAMDMKREWLVQRGAISSAFLNDTTKKALRDLAEHSPSAIVMLMMFEGEAAALRLGFEYLGTYFAYLSAYSSKLASFSPGKLLMDFCFSAARDRGDTVVDMLPPAGPHKALWCDFEVGVADYPLALNAKGAAYAFLQQKVHYAVRWTWKHMPSPIRSFVAGRLLRL